jgi:transposase
VRARETFVPLPPPPGHAQVEFGEALAVVGGERREVHFFCMDLPHSDACFVKAHPAETTEAFLDGHVSAFAFFGRVPRSVLCGNTRLAVRATGADGTRQRTEAFAALVSRCLCRDRFGRPGTGNDKGKLEALVKYARQNLLTPVPQVESLGALNAAARALSRPPGGGGGAARPEHCRTPCG